MKRIVCTIFVLVLILSLAACSSREALSAEEFTSRMTEAGHTVEDATYIFDDSPDFPATAYLIADCGEFEVEFFVFETAEHARQFYERIRRMLIGMRGNRSSYSEINLPNFNRYRQTSGGQFGVVSRIGNTVVMVITSSDNRAEVDAILDILGY